MWGLLEHITSLFQYSMASIIPLAIILVASLQNVESSEIRRIGNITEGQYQNYSAQPLVNLGDNFYYFENNVKANWYNALEFCRNVGLHLVAIETEEENALIVDYITTQIGPQDYWLGGSDFGTARTYVWMATGKRAIFFNWHDGEPNHTAGDHAMHLRFNRGVLKWNDERPYAEYGIICEQICDANCP